MWALSLAAAKKDKKKPVQDSDRKFLMKLRSWKVGEALPSYEEPDPFLSF